MQHATSIDMRFTATLEGVRTTMGKKIISAGVINRKGTGIARPKQSAALSAIIADIRSVEGFDKDQILHSFEIARTCEAKSVCVPLKKSDGGQVDLVITWHPISYAFGPHFNTSLAGLQVAEAELRELVE